MRFFLKPLAVFFAISASGMTNATPVQAATLLGDEINIVGLFPTIGTVNNGGTVTVTNGDTDRVTFGGASFAHADGMVLNFIAPNPTTFAFGSPGPDGGNFISFEDLDFDDSSSLIGVSLLSTFGGITLSDILFGADFVRFDVQGISPAAGDSIVIGLTTGGGSASPVPLPAGAPLLLSAIAVFGWLRRRNRPSNGSA